MLCGDNIAKQLKNDVDVYYYDTIDSTNVKALQMAESIQKPTLIVANHQSAGRGRLGRKFYSPTDTGLYMSLILTAKPQITDTVCVTSASAVCVSEAISDLCNINAQIKWVNDIYIEGRKVCGILAQAVTDSKSGQITHIVVGIGINVTTSDFPDDIKDIACSLGKVDRATLCAKITDNLIDTYADIKSRSFIDRYKSRSLVLGREITYTQDGVSKVATAIDIDSNGGLVIQTEDGIKTLSTGEISVRVK